MKGMLSLGLALIGFSNPSFSENEKVFGDGLEKYTQHLVESERGIYDAYQAGIEYGSTKPLTEMGSKKSIDDAEIERSRVAYHDCVLDNIKNAHTRTAANAVKSACRGRHWNKEWDSKWLY